MNTTTDLALLYPQVHSLLVENLEGRPERFQLEMCWWWLMASEEDRVDHLAFLESGGPEKIRQLRLEEEEGIPTAADLEKMLEE